MTPLTHNWQPFSGKMISTQKFGERAKSNLQIFSNIFKLFSNKIFFMNSKFNNDKIRHIEDIYFSNNNFDFQVFFQNQEPINTFYI